MMKTPRLAGLLALVKTEKDNENAETYDYDALTPSLMDEKDAQHYVNALNFACHQPDIKNIAVTGPYGAGKSSVLLTWSKRREKDLKIMTVSLADFDMIQATTETEYRAAEPSAKTEKKARQQEKSIEYSILQQILYKARKSELPYSRIERIADVTPSQTRKMAMGLLATVGFSLSGLIFLFPDYFRNKLSLSTAFSEFILNIPSVVRIVFLPGCAFFITFYLVLSKLHRMGIFDRRVSIDKIDLSKGATISTRPSDPSLLNVFIDEIVYFFERQKYNVVIFEDLDRHNDGAIFIKLREINQIINNSRPETHPVRFIYALRDDIFNSPESRTKFFDFVMPVIPVMDSQNATDHFSKKFRKDEFNVAGFEQCVARLAIFIPDMRVLNSIANEFRLYRNLVNNGENIIRLLSLIAYKNLCSRDYHLIDTKQGILYGVINSHISEGFISIVEDRIKTEMKSLNLEISEINEEHETNKHDIVRNILQIYISDKTKKHFIFSNQNGELFNLDNIINDENLLFAMLKSHGLYVRAVNFGTNIANIDSSEANEMLDKYKERCKLLSSISDGKLSVLEKRAEHLRQQRRKLQVSSLGTLIERMGSEGFRDWVSENLNIDCGPDNSEGYTASQFDFIYSLLRWEYLSTDYMSYRSIFIPGNLSSSDNEFILAVSAGRDYSITTAMPLERTANVIKKLNELGLLHQDNAWHARVLLHLLQHESEGERNQLMKVISLQLEEGEETRLERLKEQIFSFWDAADAIRYVELMACGCEETGLFLNRLLQMNNTQVASRLLVIFFCSSEMHWNYETTDMKYMATKIFSEHGDIPDMVPDGYAELFTANLRRADLALPLIGDCKSAQGGELIARIAELKLWTYSKGNLVNMVRILSNYSDVVYEQFLKKPLHTIESFNISQLNYVALENINDFIDDFFISSEEYEKVTSILNNPGLSFYKLDDLSRKMTFLISDISKIKKRSGETFSFNSTVLERSIYEMLFENNRIEPTWANVNYLVNLSDDLSPWFAIWFDRNYDKIIDIPTAFSSFEVFRRLMYKIYQSKALTSDSPRRKILSSIQLTILSLPDGLTIDEAALLVEYGKLAPTAYVYQQLYQAFHTERENIYPLLADLVLQRPGLLENEPDLILINDGEFDYTLAKLLLTRKTMPASILLSTLNWLWSYDSKLFDGPVFIASSMLPQLAPRLTDEKTLRAILVQCLKAGDVSHDALFSVVALLSDPASKAFISDLNYKSMDLTEDEWELAQLLESVGFIQSLKQENRDGRFRFVPYNSPVFRRE
ncbi:pcar [Pectobacterium brasiliense]|uniref:Pcar n=1 Tax=Pectobacterium brasiliense TaxID=180957 RepID=A0AAE3BF43_9GAMM|nr:pcar [Pectobacterium brasiliense]MBN3052239.1 pcar [Pectobacterium brasiliense]